MSDSSASSSVIAAATVDGTPIDAERRLVADGRRGVRAVERPRELLEVEGVAAALLVERRPRRRASTASPSSCASLLGRRARRARGGSACPRGARARARPPGAPAPGADARPARRAPPRPAAGAAARRAARRTPSRPSGSRRARARAAASTRVARAARAPRGGCGTARAGAPRSRPVASAVSDGKTCASSVRTSSSRAARRRRLEPSEVLVERVHEDRERQVALELRCGAGEDELPPRVRASGELGQQARLADARLADQLDARPSRPDRAPSRTRRANSISSARPTRCSVCRATSPPAQDRSGSPDREIRVQDQGGALMSARAGRRQARPMSRYLLHHSHEPHECGVVFASFRGHAEPASPPADARVVPLRRARDLVDGRGGDRRGRARAAALLRRRAHHRNARERGARSRDRHSPRPIEKEEP